MKTHHSYSITELEDMIPFEFQYYLDKTMERLEKLRTTT